MSQLSSTRCVCPIIVVRCISYERWCVPHTSLPGALISAFSPSWEDSMEEPLVSTSLVSLVSSPPLPPRPRRGLVHTSLVPRPLSPRGEAWYTHTRTRLIFSHIIVALYPMSFPPSCSSILSSSLLSSFLLPFLPPSPLLSLPSSYSPSSLLPLFFPSLPSSLPPSFR